ncbi:TPA: hypothetical protein L4965_003948 [Pseudomonas aeruginosa]|nr:hypothetical protein [Pseudomonas aeruginosa]
MDLFLALRELGRPDQMNLSYLYLKKILEEELRDHDCQCQLNPDFTVTISCRVDGPHGALYMHLARDEVAARLFVETLQRLEPELLLYCMPGSATWRIGRELGQPLVREFYADRDYDRSGSIVFTRRVAALDPQQVADKVLRACREGKVRTVEGEDLDIAFDSVCIHSDTPGALELVASTRARLEGAGIRIKAPR